MSDNELIQQRSSSAMAYANKPSVLVEAFKKYEGSVLFPYFVWAVNLLGGGTIDRIASNHVASYNIKRLDSLFEHLARRVDRNAPDPESEEFMAALHVCITALMGSTSQRKANYFAAILAHAWMNSSTDWNELSQVLKLIRELEDVHIIILREAAALGQDARGKAIIFSVGQSAPNTIPLDPKLTAFDPNLIALCISELIAKGLLNDSFTQRTSFSNNGGRQAAELVYSLSDLGRWFIRRIQDPDIKTGSGATSTLSTTT